MSDQASYDAALARVKAGENPSGLAPTEYKLVILPEYVSDRTEGGLYKPQDRAERDREAAEQGHVCAVSDMAFSTDGTRWPCRIPKVGEKVVIARYAGSTYQKDGIKFRVIVDKDVCAVVE